jgi:YHS domain-containing protein
MLMLAAGCAADGSSAAASAGPHAECLVCKKNADLACVDVSVSSKTPTYMYNGQTYYFCSDECHDKFMKNPEAYLKK